MIRSTVPLGNRYLVSASSVDMASLLTIIKDNAERSTYRRDLLNRLMAFLVCIKRTAT
jgi:hypothetical protein